MVQSILDGVRVIDLAQGIAGSVAALILAESGADVVKAEPREGAKLRGTPPFTVWNRSKRSIALDAFEVDRDTFESLVRAADVLIHDFTPQEARDRGIDDASLKQLAPDLVIAAITGFPAGHEEDATPTHDTLVLAASGIMDEQQPVCREDGPVYLRFPLGSWGAVWLAAIGIAARLYNLRLGGAAGAVRTSLLQGALVPVLMLWRRVENPSDVLAYGMPKDATNATLVECSDGVWLHFIGDIRKAPLLVETVEAMSPEEREAANKAGANPLVPDWGCFKAAFRKQPSKVWLEELWGHDVAVQPALAMGELYFDEQCHANGYVVEVEDAEQGKTRQPGMPFVTSPPPRKPFSAPRLDEHRDAILSDWTGKTPAAPAMATRSFERPLEGLRVLDLGSFLAGPLAPALLGDLGADVIKIEALRGDPMRGAAEWSFFGCQRNKRSLALDLKHPDSREVIERLVRSADIVHHNQRMPAARKLGIDYDTLSAINPRLIYCHVSSYGPVGPRKDWPGYDQLFQSSSGWEYEGAGEGNMPMWHRFGMMDHQAAMSSLYGIMLALIHRERTGRGQFVASSLLGASLLTSSETHLRADGTLAPYARLDAMQMGIGPGDRLYRAADGWLALVADDAALRRMADALGAADPSGIEAAVAGMACDEAISRARRAGADAVPARTNQMDAFLDSPENRQLGLSVSIEHSKYGAVEHPGALWHFEGQSLAFDRAPPQIGEHTREILAEAGFAREEIDDLIGGAAKQLAEPEPALTPE
jgi:crotonobetainyl-CoA:carnitine CoA-transferase CaiB-like acyl-CoA transferase